MSVEAPQIVAEAKAATMKVTKHANEDGLDWRVHTPNLIEEILQNRGAEALKIPLRILGEKLYDLAALAIEIDDPRLHLLMVDLTLYSCGDPDEVTLEAISETRNELKRRIEALA